MALKDVNLRMLDLSVCRSHVSVGLERAAACLRLPDHLLVEHERAMHDVLDSIYHHRSKLLMSPPLFTGFTIDGLEALRTQIPDTLTIHAQRSEPCFLYQWGKHGTAEGEFSANGPRGIYAHGSEIFVVDPEMCRVQVFKKGGTFLRAFGKKINPQSMADSQEAATFWNFPTGQAEGPWRLAAQACFGRGVPF